MSRAEDRRSDMPIRIDHLQYVYSAGTAYEKTALKDICLEIEDGTFLALIGHTGSGKSTLIQHLNGLIKPTAGTIYYNEEDIFAEGYPLKKLRSHVGLVFQYPENQLFETDVLTDVCFGPKNQGLSDEEAQKEARWALEQVRLAPDFWRKSPFELSGGQKRRAAIAGILAMHPSVLVLDEPTAGLDPRGRDEILDLASELHREQKITVILVSHSMEDVANYASRIVVMDHGSILMEGTPSEVFSHGELLRKAGLNVPQVTRIMHALAEDGWALNTNVTTIAEARKEILAAVRSAGSGSRNRNEI